jgi:hypothetical protein
MATPIAPYAARLNVDYPEQLDRFTTFFRRIWIIPIGIILSLLTATGNEPMVTPPGEQVVSTGGGITGGLWLAIALMIVFRLRYPRWWFDFARELTRFGARVAAYFGLLTDRYPSTVEEQAVHLEIDYPDAARPQSLVAAGEVAAGNPSLHRSQRALACGVRRGHRRMVRDSLHWTLPAGTLRLRSGGWPLEPASKRLCVLAGHRPVATVQS